MEFSSSCYSERSLQYTTAETEMKYQQNAILSYIHQLSRAAEKNEMLLNTSCLRCPTPEHGVRSSVRNENENFSGSHSSEISISVLLMYTHTNI